jgi:hypothetical protein
MQDDKASDGHSEPYKPTDQAIKDAIVEFDVLEDPWYDDDYVEMHSTVYRDYIKVFKWFKDEYDRYKDCVDKCLRLKRILEERIKWLEIENEALEDSVNNLKEKLNAQNFKG